MSYLTDRAASLGNRSLHLRQQLRDVPTKFKDRHPKERVRISKAIERDIAYVQKEQIEVVEALLDA